MPAVDENVAPGGQQQRKPVGKAPAAPTAAAVNEIYNNWCDARLHEYCTNPRTISYYAPTLTVKMSSAAYAWLRRTKSTPRTRGLFL